MKVLLSIKPEYANKIFDGSKKFEFRKAIFKNPSIKKVIVYASSPVQQVIGEFEIEGILSDNPQQLWNKTRDHSGVSEEFFFNYFVDKKIGYAIKIINIKKYKTPLCIKQNFNIIPPQSFTYIK